MQLHFRGLCAAFLLWLGLSPYAGATEIIRHYNQGYSPLLRLYLANVLKLTLDKTVAEYGPYELVYLEEFMSSNRLKLETEKGALLDLLFSPHWNGRYVDSSKVIPVEFPVLNGMLGLRDLITTQQARAHIKEKGNPQNFGELTAGLGEKWIDVDILTGNQIPVIEAHNFGALFPMLMHGRFDYIPLSTLEAHTTLANQREIHPELTLSRDVSLFYALPFYLYVHAGKPQLAERLHKGVQIALQDGSLQQLFDRHFHYVWTELKVQKRKLIVLKNPLISDERNEFYLQQLLSRYEEGFEVLHTQ